MKVLHVAETIKGGVATVLNQLLDDDRCNSLAIVPHEHLKEVEIKEKAITFNRTGRNIVSLVSLAIVFFIQILKFKPDIVHVHSSFAGLICRFLSIFIFNKKFKVIYCPHAFSFLMDTSSFKKNIYAYIEIFFLKFTDMVICTSEYEKNIAIQYGLNKDKLCVIYNSVKSPIDCSDLKSTPYDEEKLNVLFVGRFDRQKAFDFILDIAKKMPSNIKLTIVGDYVNEKNSLEIPSNVNHIKWLSRNDLGSYYYYSDLVFMPSRWESFGLVAVEAHSYGTPVFASNKSSLPEIIIENKNGFLFDEFNVDKVLIKFNKISKGNLSKMSKNCKDNYQIRFSQRVMMDSVYKMYLEVS